MATYMHRTVVVPRRAARKRTASAELVYLLVVVVAAVGTAYWTSHAVGMDLSAIRTAASMLGLTPFDRHHAGFVANARPDAGQPAGPNCQSGQALALSPAALALATQVGGALGTPLECEHAVNASGDTLQQTTTGLVAYDRLRNTVSFTDGWRHWALTPRGVVAWEGTESTPPPGG